MIDTDNFMEYKKIFGEFPPFFQIDNEEQKRLLEDQVKLAVEGKRGKIDFYEIVGPNGAEEDKKY